MAEATQHPAFAAPALRVEQHLANVAVIAANICAASGRTPQSIGTDAMTVYRLVCEAYMNDTDFPQV